MKTSAELSDLSPPSAIVDPGAAADLWRSRRTKLPAAARSVLRLLERLEGGSLHLSLPDRSTLVFGHGGPHAHVRVLDWRVFGNLLRKGDIGFAQSWIDGHWTSPSLVDVLDMALVNRQRLEQVIHGSWWGSCLYRLRHLMNRNSRAGSRRNIHAHYDLGNEFYRLWLDRTMTYSSALFGDEPDRTLEQAQAAKYQRLCDEIGLTTGQSVLEIGCGWGGFAEHAARLGLQVTGLTISSEQLSFARARLAAQGLERGAQLHMRDYRQQDGVFDAIVSIEMFEAVGEQYWDTYFQVVASRLRPGGRAAIQSIVIADELFERYRAGTDFIQQYVFPGGMLPSRTVFIERARKAGLACVQTHAFGADYATTLARWRRVFMAHSAQVLAQGFDARFMRLWEFYLAYCESAFRHRSTDVIQFTLVRQ